MEVTSGTDVFLVEDLAQQRLPACTLVAVLRQAGLTAQLVRFGTGDDADSVIALARRERPCLIVFSVLFAHLLAESLALATDLRAAGVTSHLAMAGPLPALIPTDLLAACPALDSVLCGAAEASVVQLASNLKEGIDWRDVPSLAHRAGTPPASPHSKPVLDLDTLPFPARDEPIPRVYGTGFATVEGSRGCYHACAFCLPCWSLRTGAAPPYRLRGIPSLVAEIQALYQRGVRLFLFDDEQFLPPGRARAERVAALIDHLGRQGLEIAFTIKCRADDVEEMLFRQLKAMGLIRVYLGVESGDQDSLDILSKGVTVARNVQALALLDTMGIVADFRCLLFHPWSTMEMVRSEVLFLERVLAHVPTPFTFHEVICYPGTPLAERLQAEGRDEGGLGALAYTIADPGVELLRRLRPVVFGSRDTDYGLHQRVAQAWYELLLQRRFQPERSIADGAGVLREIVTRLNRGSLEIWQEMVSLAESGDLFDTDCVNEHAAMWAYRVGILDAGLVEDLSHLT